MVGASLTGQLDPGKFQLLFGIFMFFMGLLLIIRGYIKPAKKQWKIERTFTDAKGEAWNYGYSLLPVLAVGFGVGLVSGLFGIGGGSLFVPLMVLLFRYPPHVATSTSMFVIFLSAILGSIMHMALGSVDWKLVLSLAPGAWLGGWLGARIASRMTGSGLLWLLRITLILIAIRMIWAGLS
jgi:uncharacterized membrane protein YfcA